MLDELELKLIKRLNYIPNSLLERYLEGKLLIKPDYPPTAGNGTVESRYEEYRQNMLKTQKVSNNRANPKRK